MKKGKLDKKCSQCRKVGIKLFLKGEKCYGSKCPLLKRNFPAGEHGLKRRRGKKSVYGRQLEEKQKAKEVYGVLEKQFVKYMKEAAKKTGDTGEFLLSFLESRLDNVVFRMGLGSSRRLARQLVSHAHILVNDKKVNIPSYRVKVGDVISLKEKSQKKVGFDRITDKMSKIEPVIWLAVEPKNYSAKVLNAPTIERPVFDIKSIIEFYSRKI